MSIFSLDRAALFCHPEKMGMGAGHFGDAMDGIKE
jgi:hypothetical protein